MKTILDKINPKYIECTTGTCEHLTHKINFGMCAVLAVALTYILIKYYHGTNTTRSRKS